MRESWQISSTAGRGAAGQPPLHIQLEKLLPVFQSFSQEDPGAAQSSELAAAYCLIWRRRGDMASESSGVEREVNDEP